MQTNEEFVISMENPEETKLKPCPYCQLPLARINITVQVYVVKIYYHDHCGKEIKRSESRIYAP